MSHYNIGVIIDPKVEKPDEEVSRLMQPFDENDSANAEPHWDWWVIGGRWDGEIQGKYRDDNDGGFNFGDEHHKIEFNMVPIKSLLIVKEPVPQQVMARLTRKPLGWIPHAIVTPEGQWHEKESGWGEPDPGWEAKVMELYSAYSEYNIVSVDMHD
jgi:hypothetical protein